MLAVKDGDAIRAVTRSVVVGSAAGAGLGLIAGAALADLGMIDSIAAGVAAGVAGGVIHAPVNWLRR